MPSNSAGRNSILDSKPNPKKTEYSKGLRELFKGIDRSSKYPPKHLHTAMTPYSAYRTSYEHPL
ncbi:hypothetical protein GGP41_008177 [Bipolaris sorokiniana]|uniref:Uncharacterized protein n=1 Tax=Cochliobolus sativus TaxID=45130 RepID=A0A8H6DY55_COCSA|nr:hypothetical protein GGP41_008177 [Bipolaris sorokiniana]